MFEIKEAGRQVFFDVELGVNYVTHLYTLAKAGFDDPAYVKQYASSLMPTSLEYLRANAELYSFYGRDQGPFADLLYFTPSYFNFETTEEFSDYFAAWDEAIKRKSHRPFEQYTLHSQHMIRFFSADDQTWKQEILPLDRVFAKIGRIYVDNFDTYKKEIWPNIHPVLIRCSQVLNQMMEPNLIEHWEECTGLQFEKEHYKIILYFAGNMDHLGTTYLWAKTVLFIIKTKKTWLLWQATRLEFTFFCHTFRKLFKTMSEPSKTTGSRPIWSRQLHGL